MNTIDIPTCAWNATPNKMCCPKPISCTDDCCESCKLYWVNRSVVECRGANQKNIAMFNTPYYFMQNNPNNCCKGKFEYTTNNGNLKAPFGRNFDPRKITGVINHNSGKSISYSRNQNGRWNQSTTNTKLFPVISKGRSKRDMINPEVGWNCNGKKNYTKIYGTSGPLVVQKQSGRLFKNTHPNMSKKQLFSYLSRNRRFLNR
jgi:hypothetical protein